MANQIAIWLHTKPGDGILVEENAHILHYEAAGPAMIAGVKTTAVGGQNGIMDLEKLTHAFPPDDPHCAPVTMVCTEDTANRGGGYVYPVNVLNDIAQVARDNGASTHLDGARLFNAQVKSNLSAAERTASYDTVSICFSKGLGASLALHCACQWQCVAMPFVHAKCSVAVCDSRALLLQPRFTL